MLEILVPVGNTFCSAVAVIWMRSAIRAMVLGPGAWANRGEDPVEGEPVPIGTGGAPRLL